MAQNVPTVVVGGSLRAALRSFEADRLAWLDRAAALGPVAGLELGPVTAWVVTDAGVARRMLVEDASAWKRPPAIAYPVRLGAGDNLFSQSDRAWRRLQPAVAPAFRSRAFGARIDELEGLIADEVAALPADAELDVAATTQRLVVMASAWMLFGERLDRATAARLVESQQAVLAWIGERIGRLSGASPIAVGGSARRMRRARQPLSDFADELIGRAAEADVSTPLGALAAATPGGRHLRRRAMRGHLLGLLLAGTETTAATLAWALTHAAEHPLEWQRLRDDAARARPYLFETLRLTPAAWGIPRTPSRFGAIIAAGDVRLRVRPGAVVNVYLLPLGRDPSIWPDPERFTPDRHDAGSAEQARALVPFGLGPRSCIGQQLALAELTALLPCFARRGDVLLDRAAAPRARFALTPGDGLRFSLAPTSRRVP